jgi:SAM-dependent methyltransferase
MTAEFSNVYDDKARAEAYDKLEFPGTYYLAFRDLPVIIGEHVQGRKALDFGCGTGRSTRFLRALGFDTVGVDISEPMLARARERDPEGEYRLVPDGDLGGCVAGTFDLVLSAFTLNRTARTGDKVLIVMLDVEDRRPVEDILCTDDDYHEAYKRAGLMPIKTYRPLAKQTEAYPWVSETTIAPG